MWQDMEEWVKKNIRKEYGKLTAVGTGGNISKIFELARLKPGKSLTLKKFQNTKKMIESKTIDQRIYELQMNPDRADVIVPASDIYMKVMQWAKAGDMLVPDVGLKDGILLHLLEKARNQKKLFES
jgi:exopolyphosphatase/guanosine-5'-triphosphate,3'-diphosphate pyrophosphatase